MKIREMLLCWDFIAALCVFIILIIILPKQISMKFVKDIYQIAISILSIIFSIYFAALAVIITSNDNEFIRFLEEDKIYSGIVSTFKYTLSITFIALIMSIVFYTGTAYFMDKSYSYQNKIFIAAFSFFFLYSLFSVFNASLDAITYSDKRIKYLKIK